MKILGALLCVSQGATFRQIKGIDPADNGEETLLTLLS